MKEETVTIFISDDGTKFDSKISCVEYETEKQLMPLFDDLNVYEISYLDVIIRIINNADIIFQILKEHKEKLNG